MSDVSAYCIIYLFLFCRQLQRHTTAFRFGFETFSICLLIMDNEPHIMDNEPPISDGDVSIKFSINVMMLFMHLHVHHSLVTKDCCLASCLVSPLSPNCNYRHASPYRIETLVFDPKLSVSSSALPLFCYCTKVQNNQKPSLSAFSMFNYDEVIPGIF